MRMRNKPDFGSMYNWVYRIRILLLPLICITLASSGPKDDTGLFELNSRLSFYSFEKNGEVLLDVSKKYFGHNLTVRLMFDNNQAGQWYLNPSEKIIRLPFFINRPAGKYEMSALITDMINTKNAAYEITVISTTINILNYKSNEVKTDRLTGGLIVNRRPFFPFGFYCYSPVYPTLPEEEAAKGFNMMSPYQRITPNTLQERRKYMDRCAQIGMKVHYNLLSVSGGGGVSSKIEDLSVEKKRELLINEIKTFRDHPALLAWYIADEPTGNNVTPDELEEIYKVVKENDPWHPVSRVFMPPFRLSRNYSDAMDIVMADPYPVPNSPVSQVGEVASQLSSVFVGKKPVWMVPQAFGGSEWWSREPSIQEIRSMTWQAIINGGKGIQYFVRQGLNSFPKSAATWGECGRMAIEIAEITPWLLSDEKTLPVQSGSKNILVNSELHNGQLLVMAVNTKNIPQIASLELAGLKAGTAIVLFENREVEIKEGIITDYLSPLGSQVYLISLKDDKQPLADSAVNLIKDPGFEDISSPGIPSACYSWIEGDRGATYFLDTREHYEGNHSLRIITPSNNNSVRLRFYPFNVDAGHTYRVSVWTKSDPEQRPVVSRSFADRLLGRNKPMEQYFEIAFGDLAKKRFFPVNEWKEFVTFVTIPSDYKLPLRINLVLQMPGAGVAWFDLLKVCDCNLPYDEDFPWMPVRIRKYCYKFQDEIFEQ
jgi:hypothetical protein